MDVNIRRHDIQILPLFGRFTAFLFFIKRWCERFQHAHSTITFLNPGHIFNSTHKKDARLVCLLSAVVFPTELTIRASRTGISAANVAPTSSLAIPRPIYQTRVSRYKFYSAHALYSHLSYKRTGNQLLLRLDLTFNLTPVTRQNPESKLRGGGF